MNAPTRWLLIDGLLPLLGASVLYLLWGCARYVTAHKVIGGFQYAWTAALDPMGWLYGATILAVQSGSASWSGHQFITAWVCFGAGSVCGLILLSAMTDRGALPLWTPPRSLQLIVLGLVTAILFVGYRAHRLDNARCITECGVPQHD